MNYLHKFFTLAKLVGCCDVKEILRRWKQFSNLRQVKRHKGRAFIYDDLGFRAVCHPDWQDSLEVFLDLAGDHAEMRLFKEWLEPGESCIDLGSNIGLYTFCFAEKVGSEGEVLSVDADSFIVQNIKKAAELMKQKQIRAVHAAVSDKQGELKFYVSADQQKTFEQSLAKPEGSVVSYREVTVPALTISQIVSSLRRSNYLTLIKADIEGAEAAALQGVPSWLLSQEGPLWQVEINAGALARFKATPKCVTNTFNTENFDCWLLPKHPIQDGPGQTAARRLTKAENFQGAVYYNLICVPKGGRWQGRREKIVKSLEGYARKV